MEFEQSKRKINNEENYHIENLTIARNYSKDLILEMKTLVKSIVLFGSNSQNTQNKNSDIDIMIVLDNVGVFVSEELREAYRIINTKLCNKHSKKLHIMTINLSDLWDMARKSDPVLINILRYGIALFDRDIIEPLQYLLEIGKIRPSKESIYNYISRADTLNQETQKHMQNAVLDMYYAVVDIVHATLMSEKIMPPSPKEMPEIFKKHFMTNTSLSKFSINIEELYLIAKQIEHENKQITGKEYDLYKKKTDVLVKELEKHIKKKIESADMFDF